MATDLAGEMVDQLGIVWAHETAAELGRPLVDVAAAFWAARQTLDAGALWTEIEELVPSLTADLEDALHRIVTESVGSIARSYLSRPGAEATGPLIASDRPVLVEVAGELERQAYRPEEVRRVRDALVGAGADPEIAARFSRVVPLARIADVGLVSRATKRPPIQVLATFDVLDRLGGLERLARGVKAVHAPDRLTEWQGRALLDDAAAWRRRATEQILDPSHEIDGPDAPAAERRPRSPGSPRTARSSSGSTAFWCRRAREERRGTPPPSWHCARWRPSPERVGQVPVTQNRQRA